ncbi:sensory box/GGDEF family protein [Catenovulum agarivorans DS-2]|uniref:diguanylate cyclase n=1 Tax=Catenovulum agarivorans DS-2 TaxID=1328313 RepID=W7QXA1_9ALTE|nr:GGDEF domain-containing protein [Catenovulum agarivorans]EWH09905.1 sensory box/GGDEF family protein [Catenovulum agarivorans DS-2]
MQELLQNIIDSIDDLVFVKDRKFKYIACNQAFCDFVGKQPNQVIGFFDEDLFVDKKIIDWFREWDSKLFYQDTAQRMEEWCTLADGTKVLFDTVKYPFKNEHGETVALVGISRDITEKKRCLEKIELLNQKLLYTSNHDVVTKIHNRRYFNETFEVSFMNAVISQNQVAVLLIDIDYFKQYNDRYGHLAGDDCLLRVAQTLDEVFAEYDSIVARFGGDEFIIALNKATELDVQQLANHCHETLKRLELTNSASLIDDLITLTIGAYVAIPDACDTVFSFIESADKALYQAKKQGRNQSVIYSAIRDNNQEQQVSRLLSNKA